ncbi:MAG: AI-2E family transporter [Candidatus Spechtbacterales bacterium]
MPKTSKNNNNVMMLDISMAMIFKISAVVLGVALFFRIWEIMASLFFAIVLAAAIEPTIEWLEKQKMSRLFIVPMFYILGLSAFFLMFYIFLPTLFNELWILSQDLPERYGTFLGGIFQTATFGELGFLAPALDELLLNMQERVAGIIPNVFSFISTIFGGILSFVLIIVFSFYLSLRRKDLEKSLLAVTPEKYKDSAKLILRSTQRRLGRWLQAMFVLATFIGVVTFLILSLLKVEIALTVGILAGLLELIPYVGPFIAGGIILAAGSTVSMPVGLIALLAYILLQQVENTIVVPAVMSRVVGFNPLFIIIFVLIGAELAGLWGILVAVPLAAAIAELVRGITAAKAKA